MSKTHDQIATLTKILMTPENENLIQMCICLYIKNSISIIIK